MLNEQNSTEVRRKIIDVSRELFIINGLKGTTVRDIAAKSGTNVAMVNYYFRTKENLFTEILKESLGILANKVFSITESDMPFFDIVRDWINAYYEMLLSNPQLPMFVVHEISQNLDTLKTYLETINPLSFYDKLEKRISEEEKKGTIKPTPVGDLILNIVSLSLFPFMFGAIASSFLNMDRDEYLKFMRSHKEYVIEFVISAIRK